MILVHSGEFAISVVPPTIMEGMETNQMLAWFKGLAYDGFKQASNYFCGPGDAVYCGFGDVAFIVGLKVSDSSITDPQERNV